MSAELEYSQCQKAKEQEYGELGAVLPAANNEEDECDTDQKHRAKG